jgi:hypothetical protein
MVMCFGFYCLTRIEQSKLAKKIGIKQTDYSKMDCKTNRWNSKIQISIDCRRNTFFFTGGFSGSSFWLNRGGSARF